MRFQSNAWTAMAIFGGTLLVLALGDAGCGSEQDSKFADGVSDSGVGPGFGEGGAPGDGSAVGDSGNGLVDTCGGKPCANNAGPKDFIEADVPSNVANLFGGAPSPFKVLGECVHQLHLALCEIDLMVLAGERCPSERAEGRNGEWFLRTRLRST